MPTTALMIPALDLRTVTRARPLLSTGSNSEDKDAPSRGTGTATNSKRLHSTLAAFLDARRKENDTYRRMPQQKLHHELSVLNKIKRLTLELPQNDVNAKLGILHEVHSLLWQLPSLESFQEEGRLTSPSTDSSIMTLRSVIKERRSVGTASKQIPGPPNVQELTNSRCPDVTNRAHKFYRKGQDSTWGDLDEEEFFTDQARSVVRNLKGIANLLNDLMSWTEAKGL